jgi:roadblock/LC7 domain-containing protein
VVTRKSSTVHPQSISVFSDLTLNAYVSATNQAASRQIQGGVMTKNLAGMAAMMVAAMMMMAATAVPAAAQYNGTMKVNVPFNFVVENERMAAGDYAIEKIANGRLRIHNNDGSVSTTFLALPTQGTVTPEKAHFIFHRYGGEYFLAKIWTPGQEVGWEVMQGKLEMELAKKRTGAVETASIVGR